jgi:D-beta-D-heptose 7-phosphate kinase / D-beta-D-heptose 1-phosphate adenosyltransferase
MSKVAVLGDIIIDRYVYGTSNRLSPEAPVPVITKISEIDKLGGAGNVYENLKSLGVNCTLIDVQSHKSIKTRIFCDHHYISRLDEDYIVDGIECLNKIKNIDFSSYEYVILSDYNKGVLHNSIEIIEYINSFGCKIIVDPKRLSTNYTGAWLIKPNHLEYNTLGFDTWSGNIIITNSSKPVTAIFDSQLYTCNIENVEVSDVTGAGDCFMAALVYALVKKYSIQQCLEIACTASTESVKHIGTYVLKKSDIKNNIIFTNGCFDILHVGHLTLLQAAKQLGNKLIVGINSDSSVKRLKGNTRPINNQEIRKKQLEILPWVDEVKIFDEDTPYNLIKMISPDVIVKGGDYTVNDVVGNDLAEVHIVPLVNGFSTSNIIQGTK